MKIASHLAGALLGAIFLFAATAYFLKLFPEPSFPAGSPVALFMGAMGPTGYMDFVKVCELLGGILVIVPATRNIGLLVLGPIIVNILAFHIFILKGAGFADPMSAGMVGGTVVSSLFLLYAGRRAFAGLLRA